MMITELKKDPETALSKIKCPVVVFYADWCGDCVRSLEYEKALSKEPKGKIAFYRMDAEEFEHIADRFGVERYPTYVFFRNGKALEGMLVEPYSEDEVRTWVNGKLKK
jgi:thioredoxin 1